ncbi:MAG: bifunctional UDP-N-acetylglucosamine diphosphorylase/glucosamine-1-phosphate N-acetyltransferase GlmU [Pseudomonadales bacterium]
MKRQNSPIEAVVLAAGQGKRMASARPKVLHELAGKAMLEHVLDTLTGLEARATHVVVGHGAEAVRAAMEPRLPRPVGWVLQTEQRGTGHAVQLALPQIGDDALVLVLYGDVPLVTGATLAACVAAAGADALALVTAEFDDPAELGRILRDETGAVRGIVEYRDAGPEQRAIREINSGILAAPAGMLRRLLERVRPDNAQGEIYLTDVVALAVADGVRVEAVRTQDPVEVRGVNDRAQLAELERAYQARETARLLRSGASMADPARVDVRGRVHTGRDCFLDVNVVLEGEVALGDNVYIGPGAVIRNSQIGDGVRIEAHTVVDGAEIAAGCNLGPFARIRPGTRLLDGVKIGNFVEVKKSQLGKGSKASHLAYLGDTEIGEDCNVGAGTVTCNYDGIDKHRTEIGDRVFVGTNSTLVAPLVIESDAFIAAGSTITTRVKAATLAVGRGRQRNVEGWVRPDRRKDKS